MVPFSTVKWFPFRLTKTVLLILLLAAAVIAAAAIELTWLPGGLLALGTSATPTIQAVVTQAPTNQLITFADESATWDWRATCQDALATWVQPSPNPIRTIRVTFTDEVNLGVSTVGVSYPGGKELAAIAYTACDGKLDLACQVAIQHRAPGDDLNVAITAAIPHGGVPRFSAQT